MLDWTVTGCALTRVRPAFRGRMVTSRDPSFVAGRLSVSAPRLSSVYHILRCVAAFCCLMLLYMGVIYSYAGEHGERGTCERARAVPNGKTDCQAIAGTPGHHP